MSSVKNELTAVQPTLNSISKSLTPTGCGNYELLIAKTSSSFKASDKTCTEMCWNDMSTDLKHVNLVNLLHVCYLITVPGVPFSFRSQVYYI